MRGKLDAMNAVSGQRPFEGRSTAELVRVIRRCLKKDPRQRLHTARDVANELREIG